MASNYYYKRKTWGELLDGAQFCVDVERARVTRYGKFHYLLEDAQARLETVRAQFAASGKKRRHAADVPL